MFDIKSFYEASSVRDTVRALSADPDSEVISGGTDADPGAGGKGCGQGPGIHPQYSGIKGD